MGKCDSYYTRMVIAIVFDAISRYYLRIELLRYTHDFYCKLIHYNEQDNYRINPHHAFIIDSIIGIRTFK